MSDAGLKILDRAAVDQLTGEAAASPRKRHHLLWHDSPDALVHKITMWLEPDTYVRPHLHPHADRWEMLVLLSGAIRLILFESPPDQKNTGTPPVVSHIAEMSADTIPMVQVPSHQWHTLVALEPSLLLEIKQGPMIPFSPEDFAVWAPGEGEPGCDDAILYWREVCEGDPGFARQNTNHYRQS